jgi:hypothetical protein
MYFLASEGRQRVPRRGSHGGLGVSGAVSPVGVLHAVDAVTQRVACGERLDDLHLFFDQNWDDIKTGARCPRCQLAVVTAVATA